MKAIALSMLTLFLATPVFAQEPTPEATPEATPEPEPTPEEARDLSAEIDLLRADVERLREELVAPPAGRRDGNGLRTSDLERRSPGIARIGGVATGAAVSAPDEGTELVLPRVAAFLFAPVGERVSFAAEVTILGGGAELIDADVGAPGRGDVFVQYAAADLVLVPELVVLRGGLIAVPVGRANLASDESVRELLVRPADALYLVPTPWFDLGGGLLGATSFGSVHLEWQAYLLRGPSAGIDARTGTRNSRVPPGRDPNADKALTARVVVSPAEWLAIGASGYSGAYSPGGGRRLTIGEGDVAADLGPLQLEASSVWVFTDGGTGSLGLPIPKRMWGGSGQASLSLLPETLGAVLPAAWQDASFAASFRYSIADTDLDLNDEIPTVDDPLAYTRRDRLAVGLALRPVEGYVLRAEYEFRAEAGTSLVDDDRGVLSATIAF